MVNIMNYELAKKLKDAGFPQSKQWGEITDIDNKVVGFVDKYGNKIVPTLEELIDACGDDFIKLHKDMTGFVALGDPDNGYSHKETVGKTPTEAVAMLYLELNK